MESRWIPWVIAISYVLFLLGLFLILKKVTDELSRRELP